MSVFRRTRLLFYLVFVLTVSADLITKWATFHYIGRGGRRVAIAGIFDLHPVVNRGGVFGLFHGMNYLFIPVSVIACSFILYILYCQRGKGLYWQVTLALVLSGVIGNLYDRVRYEWVRDFIDFGWWPCFNLADAFIVVGGALIALSLLLEKETGEQGKKKQVNKETG